MNRRDDLRILVLVGCILAAVGLNAYWFVFGEFLRVAQPGRVVVGACLIFVLPGLVWGDVLGLRARSVLETIALAFALTLTLEIALLAVIVPLRLSIAAWVAALLGVTALGVAVLVARALGGKRPVFAAGLVTAQGGSRFLHAAGAVFVVIPVLLAVAAYRWGEVIQDLGGEKYVHLTFVRYYFQKPLALEDLGIGPHLPPPNLIHLWEFLVAGWARCIQTDPLPLFCHARFVVPVLGFAGMYLLTRMIFVSRKTAAATFAVVLVLCLSGLVLDASNLTWVRAIDPTRRVFTFLGSAHHADTAMDILIALTAGMVLWWMRRPTWSGLPLLVGILTANFLWHPREFLQVALYLGLLGLTVGLLPSLRRRAVWQHWATTMMALVGVALVCTLVSTSLVPRESHGYDELALKRQAMAHALQSEQVGTVRNLFNYPLHCCLCTTVTPDVCLSSSEVVALTCREWNLDLWLFLAAGSMVLLGVFGRPRDQQLAFYHLLLWVLALSWNASMLLVLALTYSEFFHSTPRLIYIFAFLISARGFLVLGGITYAAVRQAARMALSQRRWSSVLASVSSLAVMAGVGFALRAWVRAGKPEAILVATALTTAGYGLFLLVLPGCRNWRTEACRPSPGTAMVLAFAALMPVSGKGIAALWRSATRTQRAEIGWFQPGNPFAYSAPLTEWLGSLPPGHVLLTNPLHGDVPCVYSAQYLAIHGTGSIIKDIPECANIQHGRHPIFRSWPSPETRCRKGEWTPALLSCTDFQAGPASWLIDHAQAVEWLRRKRVSCILINRQDYTAGVPGYFLAHPEHYAVLFHNPAAREIIFHFWAPPGALK